MLEGLEKPKFWVLIRTNFTYNKTRFIFWPVGIIPDSLHIDRTIASKADTAQFSFAAEEPLFDPNDVRNIVVKIYAGEPSALLGLLSPQSGQFKNVLLPPAIKGIDTSIEQTLLEQHKMPIFLGLGDSMSLDFDDGGWRYSINASDYTSLLTQYHVRQEWLDAVFDPKTMSIKDFVVQLLAAAGKSANESIAFLSKNAPIPSDADKSALQNISVVTGNYDNYIEMAAIIGINSITTKDVAEFVSNTPIQQADPSFAKRIKGFAGKTYWDVITELIFSSGLVCRVVLDKLLIAKPGAADMVGLSHAATLRQTVDAIQALENQPITRGPADAMMNVRRPLAGIPKMETPKEVVVDVNRLLKEIDKSKYQQVLREIGPVLTQHTIKFNPFELFLEVPGTAPASFRGCNFTMSDLAVLETKISDYYTNLAYQLDKPFPRSRGITAPSSCSVSDVYNFIIDHAIQQVNKDVDDFLFSQDYPSFSQDYPRMTSLTKYRLLANSLETVLDEISSDQKYIKQEQQLEIEEIKDLSQMDTQYEIEKLTDAIHSKLENISLEQEVALTNEIFSSKDTTSHYTIIFKSTSDKMEDHLLKVTTLAHPSMADIEAIKDYYPTFTVGKNISELHIKRDFGTTIPSQIIVYSYTPKGVYSGKYPESTQEAYADLPNLNVFSYNPKAPSIIRVVPDLQSNDDCKKAAKLLFKAMFRKHSKIEITTPFMVISNYESQKSPYFVTYDLLPGGMMLLDNPAVRKFSEINAVAPYLYYIEESAIDFDDDGYEVTITASLLTPELLK